MNQYDITFIGCDNIFKNVVIKLGKTKEKIIKSQIEHLNSDNYCISKHKIPQNKYKQSRRFKKNYKINKKGKSTYFCIKKVHTIVCTFISQIALKTIL